MQTSSKRRKGAMIQRDSRTCSAVTFSSLLCPKGLRLPCLQSISVICARIAGSLISLGWLSLYAIHTCIYESLAVAPRGYSKNGFHDFAMVSITIGVCVLEIGSKQSVAFSPPTQSTKSE